MPWKPALLAIALLVVAGEPARPAQARIHLTLPRPQPGGAGHRFRGRDTHDLTGLANPFYAGPGAAAWVGQTAGPEQAVAPTDLGQREEAEAVAWNGPVDPGLPDAPASYSAPVIRSSSGYFPRPRPLAPPIDLDAQMAKLQAWERTQPGALIEPLPPLDPRLPAWAATYRLEAAKLRAAAGRALAERSLAACSDLERAIRASRIPHAPRPELEASAAAALVWLAKGADSCSYGMRDTTSLRLDEGRQGLEALDRELQLAIGRR